MSEEITQDDKLWALLSWLLWPVAVIALLIEDKKQRPFVKYNAVQALAVGVIGYFISAILASVIVGCFTGLAVLIYTIYLGIQSYQGQWVTVPFITDFCKKQGWIQQPS
jgi:uncharacterized membrane protein